MHTDENKALAWQNNQCHATQIMARPHEPQPSYPSLHPTGLAPTPWTPLSCGMAGWWQINSILANI